MPPPTLDQMVARDITRAMTGSGFDEFVPVRTANGASAFRGALSRHVREADGGATSEPTVVSGIHASSPIAGGSAVSVGDVYQSAADARKWKILEIDGAGAMPFFVVQETN